MFRNNLSRSAMLEMVKKEYNLNKICDNQYFRKMYGILELNQTAFRVSRLHTGKFANLH